MICHVNHFLQLLLQYIPEEIAVISLPKEMQVEIGHLFGTLGIILIMTG